MVVVLILVGLVFIFKRFFMMNIIIDLGIRLVLIYSRNFWGLRIYYEKGGDEEKVLVISMFCYWLVWIYGINVCEVIY